MIYTTLFGGMGNQMFQYAIARQIAKDTNQDIFIDLSYLSKTWSKCCYALDVFNIPANVIVGMSKKRHYYNSIPMRLLIKLIPETSYNLLSNINYFISFAPDKEVKISRLRADIVLQGYWQSKNHFKDCRQELLQDFQPNVSKDIHTIMGKMHSEMNSVCLHWRMGDYKQPGYENFDVCNDCYYFKSMEMIKQRLDHPHFYVFTNSVPEVKRRIIEDDSISIIDSRFSAIESLAMMMSCNHFIISNSTFSWWAQYLCGNDDKIVIAPYVWYRDDSHRGLFDDHWILNKEGIMLTSKK